MLIVTPDISGVRIKISGIAAQPLGPKVEMLGAAAQQRSSAAAGVTETSFA